MKPAVAFGLLVIGVAAIGAGWYFGTGSTLSGQQTISEGQLAFPGLAADMAKATSITLQHQDKTLVLDRQGDHWGVSDHGGYPVIPTRVHGLLAALTELRLVERRTTDTAELPRLGLDAPSATAGSTLLRVLDAGGHPLAELLVGHQRVHAGGAGGEGDAGEVYVRRPAEPQAWLASGRLDVDADPQAWFDRDITSIDHSKVKAVAVTHGETHLDFAQDGDKLVMKAPADHPPLADSRVEDIGRALEFLSFADVQPAEKMPGTPDGDATYTLADGVHLSVAVTKAGEDYWGRFDATGDGDAAAKAKTLHDKLNPWAYKLPSWKIKALVPTLDDLVPPPPPPTQQPPAPQPPAPQPPAPQPPEPTKEP
jgi:hypothetical protein